MAKCFLSLFFGFILLVTGFMLASPTAYADYSIDIYRTPTNNSRPGAMTSTPDGNIWFAEVGVSKVGKITPAGQITEYPLGYSGGSPLSITSTSDGSVWFSPLPSGKLGRIAPNGDYTELQLTSIFTGPFAVTTGPDGNIWFTRFGSAGIGRYNPTTGEFAEFTIPGFTSANNLTAGPDGNIWIGASNENEILKITPDGLVAGEYQIPTQGAGPVGITSGPDGNIWFIESSVGTTTGNGRIARITPSGVFTEFQFPAQHRSFGLGDIVSGSDGNLWFTNGGRVGRITTDGVITNFETPGGTAVDSITSSTEGNIWFSGGSSNGGNAIGVLYLQPQAPQNLTVQSPTLNPSLSWGAVNGATSYKVYRNGTNITTTTSASYIDNSAPEGTHTYYVTAVSGGGESNPSTSINVLVDRTQPIISAQVSPQPNNTGWNNTNVTVTFTCADEGSGVAICPDPVTVSQEGGGQIIEGTATDNAGNSASTSVTLNTDKTDPSISHVASPSANSFGWNNSDVTVNFNCTDALSGVASCTSPQIVSTEGANQSVAGTATDNAGNTAFTAASVSLDKTNPTITYSLSPAPNQYGWHNSDVTVTFSCSDALSGINACPAPYTVTQEGGGQIIEGTASDKSGNLASAMAMVNIDKSLPAVSNLAWSANPLQQGQSTTLSATVTDSLSGISAVQYSIDGGTPQAMSYNLATGKWEAAFGSALTANTYTINITATDMAGNVSPVNSGSTDILAVYNAANGYVTGHAKTLPTASDVMPIPRDTSANPAKLIAGFSNVTSPMSGSFDINYKIKNNQNEFSLSSTSINWVVVQDSTHASILGRANLVVYQNGVMTQTNNMSVRIDITLGTNGNPDTISIRIFNPSDNPNTATPIYTINDTVIPTGSNLMIHP